MAMGNDQTPTAQVHFSRLWNGVFVATTIAAPSNVCRHFGPAVEFSIEM